MRDKLKYINHLGNEIKIPQIPILAKGGYVSEKEKFVLINGTNEKVGR